MVTRILQGLRSSCLGGLGPQFWICTSHYTQDVINTTGDKQRSFVPFCFFVVAAYRDPVWEDRAGFWGWQALWGFQTSEGGSKQLLMKDKARTSCSPFPPQGPPHLISPLLSRHIRPIFSCGSRARLRYQKNPNCMFHKGCFCSDVFLIIVLRQNDDLWNESGAWGPSVPVESTSRCLIGLNGIRRKGVAGSWEACEDLTVN